jgi:hypothetical protein
MQSTLVRAVLLFAFAFSLMTSGRLLAQGNTTALSGTIVDATGAIMPGVTVTISNAASGKDQATKTSPKGDFAFAQLQPGTYTVKVVAPGFSTETETVDLLVATPMKLDFRLTAGSSDVVNVETNLADINTSDATLGKAFNSQQVQDLPYLANNVTYLLSLQPGVLALDSGATTGGLNTDTRTGIVNGARQDQTNITLDGVDNNDQIFGYAFNGALRSTRDSVEEFRVTTTNANADAGRSSGAQVSLVTKSGTNVIHGSAYEYYRDPATTSNNWFNKQSQLSSGEPNIAAKVLQHTYGASLGLPLMKDKLFFFGAYEGFKQASDVPVGRTVPSTFGSSVGNVMGLASGTVTYLGTDGNPHTLSEADIATMDGRASDSNCVPISSCYAPATDTAAVAYFNASFPLANAPGAADSYNTGNFNFVSPSPIHQITNIARIDYNINSKQSVFARGNLQSDNQASVPEFPGLPPASKIYGNSKGMAAGHIWTINDRMTNNARYGLIRIGSASRGVGSGVPYVSFGDFDNSTSTTTTTKYTVTTNNFSDDYTFIKGRHTIQAGANIYLISNAQYFDSNLLPYSNISPNLLATAAIANQKGSYDPGVFGFNPVAKGYSNFYNNAIISNIGAIETAQSGTEFQVAGNNLVPLGAGIVPTHTFKNVEQEYYVQDQWKATSNLTLTAGLRYVYLGVPYEKNGQQIAPTISANAFLAAREAAAAAGTGYDTDTSFRPAGSPNGQPNFWTPQKLNFAPRIAFAYSTPDNKSSIRGGFALAFDHFGSAVIDTYQANPQSLFSLSQVNLATYTDINSNPRFTGYGGVPVIQGATTSSPFPYTPAESPFTFDYSINDHQKTPYAETFNLTLQHEFSHNVSVTASYVGRLGRHLIQNLDIAMPTNLADSASGQTYFQAATAYDKMVDQGVDPSTVPDSGYFHNVFPNFTYDVKATSTTPAIHYTGAQAYYAVLANNRGNETNALFAADTDPTASAGGQSFRFFYPQTSSIAVQSSTGSSNYNALQLSMRQELHSGLEYDVNYTFSKSIDEGSDPERNGTSGSLIINSFSPHQWRAVSDFDVRHNITANYSAPFPFGRGAMFLNHGGLTDRLFGGFQLNGVIHYSTGFPFSAVAAGNWGTNFAFNSNMVQTGKIPTGGHHYDKVNQEETALNGITSAQATSNLRFAYVGEAGQRNNFRSDGYLSLDDGLSKSFHIWGEHQLKLSAEVFNVLNTNRFATPETDGTSSTSFGVYENAAGQSNDLLQTSTSSLLLQPRQMQFSGKFIF